MAAVNLPNASVTGPVNSPIPNPIAPINNPAIVDPENPADLLAPLTLSTISEGFIGSPVIVTAENAPVSALPVIVTAESIPSSATPNIVTSESVGVISTPAIIAANALDPTTPPFALNHARILYNNFLTSSTVSSSGGTNPSYALLPNTFQSWAFTLTTTQDITITLPAAVNIDTICLGAHNLGGTTIAVDIDPSAAGTFVEFAPDKTPATNDAIMFHVSSAVSVRRIKITVSGATGLAYKIGYITAGIALQMARPFFSGHNPMDQNKKHRYYDAWTETGNMVGRALRSVQLEGDFSWDNLPDAWYRSYMPAFIESATRFPYIIAWNLLEYPDDVAMAFTDGDISSPYSGTRNLRSVSFTARGIA